MTLRKLGWITVFLLVAAPYAALVAAGTVWLHERRLLWIWLGAAGVLTLVGWFALERLRRHTRWPAAGVRPDALWTPRAKEAYRDVEAIAERVQAEDLPVDRPGPLWDVLREVLETVAAHYHPESKQAALEVPVPHVLLIVELVSRDLREAFSERVPGAHILTLHDFVRMRWLAGVWRRVYFLWRVASFGFSPVAAILREIRQAAAGGLVSASRGEVKQWAVGFSVRKAGYYAIQLYSGQLVLDGAELAEFQTRGSRRALHRAKTAQDRLEGEPLRILVTGQVKAGKSSLINALFGETRAAVDVVPRTASLQPYLLERRGIPQAIIFDTAGYQDGEEARHQAEELREEALRADLILLVCSARSAARRADRQLLDEIRRAIQAEPDRRMPPVVAVLAHVDQLRPFAEWDPPYDLVRPQGTKAEQIAAAADAVRQDLALEPDQPVVPVCLKEGMVYNVEEGLAAAMIESLPEARQTKCLRCLRAVHDRTQWRKLWQQAVAGGRLLLRARKAWKGPKSGE